MASADPRPPLREATVAGIEPSYFDVLETPILAGRAFNTADLAPGSSVAIVDQGFVDQMLQGRNPIGQQVRFVQDADDAAAKRPNPWFEVVGVVKELGMGAPTRKGRAAGFYLPATPDRFDQVYMMVHVRGDPMTLGPQLREIAAAVDPTLRLSELQRVNEVTNNLLWVVGLWLRVTIVMTAVALLLSLAGIYAVLSFIVARRTREIGIRVALGASRRRVIAAIFRRPLITGGTRRPCRRRAHRRCGQRRNRDAWAVRLGSRSRMSRCSLPTPPSCWASASSRASSRRAAPSAWSRPSRCGWISPHPILR